MTARLSLLLLLCTGLSATPKNSIEDDFAKAIETIDTNELLGEFFSKHPELLERSELFKTHLLDLAHAEEIRTQSKKISGVIVPVSNFIKTYVPAVGGTIASALQLVATVIENGGLFISKLEEAQSKYDMSVLKIISSDEIIIRALVDTYYTEILPAAKKLDNMTVNRETMLSDTNNTNSSILDRVSKILSPGVLVNTFEDLTDKTFLTENIVERTKQVKQLMRRLKLGKLRFEYYVRTLQIKVIEREIMESQKYQAWMAHFAKRPRLIEDIKEEITLRQKDLHELNNTIANCGEEEKPLLLETLKEAQRQLGFAEENYQDNIEQQQIVKMLLNEGVTKENLMQNIEQLKQAVKPLILLNDTVHEEISNIDKARQIDELTDKIKVLEGKLGNN